MTAKLEMTWYLHDTYRGSALMYTDHEDIVAMEKFKGPYVIAQVSNSCLECNAFIVLLLPVLRNITRFF